jgi:hypothetical protein
MSAQPQPTAQRIAPAQAADSAAKYLASLVPLGEPPRVEETELAEDERSWSVTLSFQDPSTPFMLRRQYKVFRIDAYSGEVKSMKIRQV